MWSLLLLGALSTPAQAEPAPAVVAWRQDDGLALLRLGGGDPGHGQRFKLVRDDEVLDLTPLEAASLTGHDDIAQKIVAFQAGQIVLASTSIVAVTGLSVVALAGGMMLLMPVVDPALDTGLPREPLALGTAGAALGMAAVMGVSAAGGALLFHLVAPTEEEMSSMSGVAYLGDGDLKLTQTIPCE